MPRAYVIADVEVTDAETYEEYKRLSAAAVKQYHGRWVVRGGAVDVLEGEWQPERIVVVEFEDEHAARQWYDSPEYGRARELRQRSAHSSFLLVNGP